MSIKAKVKIEDSKQFKKRLNAMLKYRKYDKQSVASAIGISKQQFNGYITNKCFPTDVFSKLCLTLSCSQAFLLGISHNYKVELKDEKVLPLAIEYHVANIDEAIAKRLIDHNPLEMHKIINFLEGATPDEFSQLMRFIESFDKRDTCKTTWIARRAYSLIFKNAFIKTLGYEYAFRLRYKDKDDDFEKLLHKKFINEIINNVNMFKNKFR